MAKRIVIAACGSVGLLIAASFGVRAEDKTILIELDRRSSTLATAVSASGAAAVGVFNPIGAFYWMPTTGIISLGGLAAEGVSRDGNTIVGSALDSRGLINAAIWSRAAEWTLLGSFPNAAPCVQTLSNAYDVSRDGQVVVGSAWNGCGINHAFRWQQSTGVVDLGSSVAGEASSALGVTGDGSVVVGHQVGARGTAAAGFRQGARWTNGRQDLIPGVDGFVGTARAANVDGSIVVGENCRPADESVQSAWVWTTQNGTRCLPPPRRMLSPGPLVIVTALATSDDGTVIGGGQNIGGSADSNAILWIDGQPAYLKDFLQANGLPDAFRTWVNTGEITGISPDGRIIVGWGAAGLGFRGYMIILGSSRAIPPATP